MLTTIAEGVHVHQSACIETNTTIVEGSHGVLVIDPGLTVDELASIASDLRVLGLQVVAGFSTHPDWDHALWYAGFGDGPRYATARAAAALRELLSQPDWQAQMADAIPPEVADDLPMELFGQVTGLPPGTRRIPWDGPVVRIIEHRAHAVGHAALYIEDRGVLVAGDMLSDVLVPMPDLHGDEADPLGDYLAALQLLEDVAGGVEAVIPGHGSPGASDELVERIQRDRRYVLALRNGEEAPDPRVGSGAKPGWEWVSFIHEGNVERVAGSRS